MMETINEHYGSEQAGLYIGGIHPEILEHNASLE